MGVHSLRTWIKFETIGGKLNSEQYPPLDPILSGFLKYGLSLL